MIKNKIRNDGTGSRPQSQNISIGVALITHITHERKTRNMQNMHKKTICIKGK